VEVHSLVVSTQSALRSMWLSEIVGRSVSAQDGQRLGKVKDLIVRLDLQLGHQPPVIGLVVTIGRRDLFVPQDLVGDLGAESVVLATARLDLRSFERREGEILVKQDLMGHRLIDVTAARLVRARDVELAEHAGWVLAGIDTSPRGHLARLLSHAPEHASREWSDFEALIGHDATARLRAPFSRLRRLRPAQLADLVEAATRDESEEILDAVGTDKELEADVFEELEPDRQIQVLRDRTDEEVADVLAHMGADDAADLLGELAQERRLPILGMLPPATQTKIRALLGFHPSTAGGLMTPDLLALPPQATAQAALQHVRTATSVSTEALLGVYVVQDKRLVGSLNLPALLRADPTATLDDLADPHPVCVTTDADITEVAVRMTDFNLVTIPVVDPDNQLLGVITVDDVLEATVPEEWWNRVEDVEEVLKPRHHAENLTSREHRSL
jgi:CBS domain-containing protein/sporulation protein YlmC with PRC-barrel domain